MEENKPIIEQKEPEVVVAQTLSPAPAPVTRNSTPKQDSLRAEIAQCSSDINALKTLLSGLNPRADDRAKIKILNKMRDKLASQLNRCQNMVKASSEDNREVLKGAQMFPRSTSSLGNG